MPGKLIGGKQPPWAFVVRDENDDYEAVLRSDLERHFTRVEFVTREQALNLHQGEFDVAIILAVPPHQLDAHLDVVQFCGQPAVADQGHMVSTERDPAIWSGWRLSWLDAPLARQFSIPEEVVEAGLANLVEATVKPPDGSAYQYLEWQMVQGPGDVEPPAHTLLRPLLADSAGRALAARVSRGLDPWAGELWCLSTRAASDITGWVAGLVRYWRLAGHRAFDAASAWAEDPAWMTHAEDRSLSAYQGRLQEIEVKRAELAAELEGLMEVREDARRQADSHERRLLTCQGPDLVEEVNATLVRLGFDVIDADNLPQHTNGRKQEDLRIKDGAWTCLAEVKGYSKGNAKTSDLQQLGKAVRTFVLAEQREPDAQWYIVNQSFRTPPDDRPEPFAGAQEDAEVFARDNGLVIDSRALFRLDKDVQAGSLSPTDARRILREATGVLAYPPSPEEENA